MNNLIRSGKSIIDKDIVLIEVSFINFDGDEDKGVLEVHKNIKDEVINIFKEIKELRFPIFKMEAQYNPIASPCHAAK